MNWPQWIWVCLQLLMICIVAEEHGKPRTGNYDVRWTLVSVAVGTALLWWGGFFGGVQ